MARPSSKQQGGARRQTDSPPPMSARRREALRETLERVEARCDLATRREADPVSFVHQFHEIEDRELVALVASCFAFGNAKAFRGKIRDLLARLGPSPAAAADDPGRLAEALRGFKHRLYDERHVAGLLLGGRRVQRARGSLGAAFTAALHASGGDLLGAVTTWTALIRAEGGLDRTTGYGAAHILPRPDRGGANKRLMLLLRWMARPADGVDLGLWEVPAASLVIPLDVHLLKLGRNLGFTRASTATWRAAREVTDALAHLDPDDPTRFDFSLCHLGMVQRCPSRRDAARCEGCGVRPVCRHWERQIRGEGRGREP